MKYNETLIFTATYNEAENIKKLLTKILSVTTKIDIFVIDDNSPDKTYEIIRQIKSKHKNIYVKKRSRKLGLDTAHKMAFNYAKKKKYKKFISMDADLSHDPKEIKKFINNLDKFPFVIGSRYMLGGSNKMSLPRYILSYFGNIFIKNILNLKYTEFTTSYRGFNLEKLNSFSLDIVKSRGYSFFMETVFRIDKAGYKIKEIPIIFESRKKGNSKIPKIETLRTLKNVFLLYLDKNN